MNKVPWALIALIVVGITFPLATAFAALDPRLIISFANGDRAAQSLAPLSENALLDKAAQLKADDMAAKGYYSHITPEGYAPFHWFDAVGYAYLNVGENLDLIYSGNEETINSAWMGSLEHRANILQPQFTEIGVGIARGKYRGVEGTFAVQLFGTPMPPAPLVEENVVLVSYAPAQVKPATIVEPSAPPSWAILQIQYSPERFTYLLQTLILSLQESTRQLFTKVSPGGVY